MHTEEIFNAKFIGEISKNVTKGTITVYHFDQKLRAKRAFKTGGILFGLAILSIAVPILHFVLVPSFLIATPIGAVLAYGVESRLMGAKAQCPECQIEFKIAPGKPQFPYRDVCEACHRVVTVETTSA